MIRVQASTSIEMNPVEFESYVAAAELGCLARCI
jgi:hypothetical protein